jgi:uncharacterized protein (DUF1684 family)
MVRMLPRKPRWALFLALLPAAIPLAGLSFAPRPAAAQTAVTSAESEWRQDLEAWRTRRAQEIGSPTGPLTLIGLEWLKPGANSLGAAPDNQIQIHAEVPGHIGLFTVSGKAVQLLAIGDGFPMDLTIDGQSAREGALVVDGPKPSVIGWRGLSMTVLDRGGRFALRINDSDSPARTAFHGLNWYPADPQLSVEATWAPFNPPHTEAIPTGLGTTLNLPSPGHAEFTLGDQKLTLEPVLESSTSQTLFFILSDATGKDVTFAGGRYLHAPLPSNGLDKPGKLILDFNRLENPACAYTANAGCPQPPEKNRLPASIEAGEKRYTP